MRHNDEKFIRTLEDSITYYENLLRKYQSRGDCEKCKLVEDTLCYLTILLDMAKKP